MTSRSYCRTVLLSDVPSKKDLFEGRHEKVAKAINDLITNEEGGKTIGLEGPWGSGKSTVVGMVRDQFESLDQVVVTFDAYEHEGDPLRVAFLDGVSAEFENRNDQDVAWLDMDWWRKKRDLLSLRRKESEKLTISPLSGKGVAFSLMSALVPIGIALLLAALSGFLAPGTDFNWGVAWTLFGLGLALILLPVGYLAYFAFRHRKEDESEGSVLNKLFKDGLKHDRSVEIQSPDPTSIEFANAFDELFGSALSADENRRALIILDNLDRMESEQARRIWSTLQTFLEFSNSRSVIAGNKVESWRFRIWILVPYAASGMQTVWGSNGEKGDVPEHEKAANFMEKRIQVRFQVPPPILTDSGKYLDYLLNRAFPNHIFDQSVAEKSEVQAIYNRWSEQFGSATGAASTPRHMKQFVNGVGALHRVFQHRHGLSKFGYYHAVTRENSGTNELVGSLRKGTPPRPDLADVCGLNPSDATAVIASILFSATKEEAVEMLLRPVVDDALSSGDGTALKRAGEAHGQAFLTTLLSSSKIGFEQNNEPRVLLRSATALHTSNLEFESVNRVLFTKCLGRLSDALKDVNLWAGLQRHAADDYANTVLLFRETAIADLLLAGLSRIQSDSSNWNIWLDSVQGVLEASKSVDVGLSTTTVQADTNFPTYLDICESIADSRNLQELGSFVVSTMPDLEILDQLSGLIATASDDAIARKTLSALKVLSTRGNGEPSQDLLTAIYENLHAQRIPSGVGAADLVSILQASDRSDLLDLLAAEGTLLHYFNGVFQDGEFNPAAILFLAHYSTSDEGVTQSHVGASDEGLKLSSEVGLNPRSHLEFVGACAEVVSNNEFSGLKKLVHILRSEPNWDKLVEQIVTRLDEKALATAEYSFAELVQDKDQWLSTLHAHPAESVGFRMLIRARLENTPFLNAALVAKPDPKLQSIYEYIAVALLDRSRESRERGENELAIGRLAEAAQFVEHMESNQHKVVANSVFSESLATEIVSVSSNEMAQPSSTALNAIDDLLDVESRSVVWASVRDGLLQVSTVPDDQFFDVFGTRLMAGLSDDKSTQQTMDLIFRIAEERSAGGLRWVLGFREEFADFFFIPEVHKGLESLVTAIGTAGNKITGDNSKEYEAVAKELADMLYSMIDFEKDPPDSKK